MKKNFKLLVVSVCFIMFTCQFSLKTEAGGEVPDRVGEVVDGSVLTNNTSAEGTYQPLLRGTYLATASCGLSLSPVGVNIGGETVCYRTCDRVEVKLFLEKQVGSSWKTVVTRNVTTNNAPQVMYSETVYAASGYFYRVRANHLVAKGSITETATTYSDGLYVK